MNGLTLLLAFLSLLMIPYDAHAQRVTDRPMIHITEKTAESACIELYYHLSHKILASIWEGEVRAYKDSALKEHYQVKELKQLTTIVEPRQIINPKNPDDPYDIIDVIDSIPFDPYKVVTITTKSEVVYYWFFPDIVVALKKRELSKILTPAENWLLSLSENYILTYDNVRILAIEAFSAIENTIYKSLETEKINKYLNDSLESTISNKEAYAKGSWIEYSIRWKDTTDNETKKRIKFIDSLRWAQGRQVYLLFDSALNIMDTVYHPFIPEKGIKGVKLSLEPSSSSLLFSYSISALAPTYSPPAAGITLPRPWPMFWLKKEDALRLLSNEQKLLLETVYSFALRAGLDPSFDSLYYEEYTYR